MSGDKTGMLNLRNRTLMIDGRALPVIMCSNSDRLPCDLAKARYVFAGPDEEGYSYLVEVPVFGDAAQ